VSSQLDNSPALNRDLTPDVIDGILKQTFPELVRELESCAFYASEHAVINLFVFGYLVPALQNSPGFRENGWDLTLVGMEVSVAQIQASERSRPRTRKDLVFWRQPRSTRFKNCDLSRCKGAAYVREHSHKPLAVIEWKNISASEKRDIQAEHRGDLDWFRRNLGGGMLDVGYAVVIDQTRERVPQLCCHRLSRSPTGLEENPKFIVLPQTLITPDS
jgi:hypothetical protein